MSIYARDAGALIVAAAASGTTIITQANVFARHQADVRAASGSWRAWWEASPDGGTTWIVASDVLTLTQASETTSSGIVPLVYYARMARFRYVLDSGPGILHTWLIQDDDNVNGAR